MGEGIAERSGKTRVIYIICEVLTILRDIQRVITCTVLLTLATIPEGVYAFYFLLLIVYFIYLIVTYKDRKYERERPDRYFVKRDKPKDKYKILKVVLKKIKDRMRYKKETSI